MCSVFIASKGRRDKGRSMSASESGWRLFLRREDKLLCLESNFAHGSEVAPTTMRT